MSHLEGEEGARGIRRLSRADSIGDAPSNYGGISEVDTNKYLLD